MSRRRGDPHAVVPDVEARTYYDQPVLKAHVWTWEVPTYFLVGGMAGASSVVAAVARAGGDPALARVAERAAAIGALVSPALLVSDLGRPSRFLNMLRVVKVTSPMSVGSWILATYAPAAVGAVVLAPVPAARRVSGGIAAALGPCLATYTAVLVADTAVPVWHGARRELPFVFVGGALQAAGGVAVAALPPSGAAAGRRVLLGGAVLREAAERAMDRRLGEVGRARHEGTADRLHRASRVLSVAGVSVACGPGRRRRAAAVAGGVLAGLGALAGRFAVMAAGTASAADPQATMGPQRRRVDERESAGRSTRK